MDPERPIEKLLRQAAQARRAEAGPPQELHPANRRMLQSEVARKYASAAPPEKRSFFELFMPRIAWAFAVFVGLGLAASLMVPREGPRQSEMILAKNDRLGTVKEAAPPAPATAKSVAPAETSSVARADLAQAERDKDTMNREGRRTEPQNRPLAFNESAAEPKPAPGAAGAPAEAKQKKEIASAYSATSPPQTTPAQTPVASEEMLQRRYGLATRTQAVPASGEPVAPQPALTAASPATASVAGSSVMKLSDEREKAELALKTGPSNQILTWSSSAAESSNTNSLDLAKRSPAPVARVTQKFVNAETANKITDFADQSNTTKPILAAFELQQTGREVRIVDSDGSVYTGTFQLPEIFTYLHSAAAEKPVVTRSLQDSERQSGLNGAPADSKLLTELRYFFGVTGTNQSLKQRVTFTGEVLTPTNALSQLGSAGTLNGARFAPPELNPLPLGDSRITGKAVIGGNREIQVNAVPPH
jgi:hypothetical protein